MQQEIILKVLMIGSQKSGKTQMIYTFQGKNTKPTKTIGLDYYNINYQNAKLQIWDCSGDQMYRNIIKPYCKNSNIILFFCKTNNGSSLQYIQKILDQIENIVKQNHFILIQNEFEHRILTHDQIQFFVKKHNLKHEKINALNKQSVDAVMKNIFYQIITKKNKQQIDKQLVLTQQKQRSLDEQQKKHNNQIFNKETLIKGIGIIGIGILTLLLFWKLKK